MTFDEARRIVARVTYKPGYTFELRPARDTRWTDMKMSTNDSVIRLNATVQDALGETEHPVTVLFDWAVPHNYLAAIDEDWIFKTIRNLVLKFEEHEAMEWLKIDGDARWNPHRHSNIDTTQ